MTSNVCRWEFSDCRVSDLKQESSRVGALLDEIDTLFEKSPALRDTLLLKSTELTRLASDHDGRATPEVITFVTRTLQGLKRENLPVLDDILNCHPRLGAKKVDSTHSQAEQKSLSGSPEEGERLRVLNESYERQFPGLRYVVFVNGRTRSIIMENMQFRISRNDINLERDEGIAAMADIARDRLAHSKTL